MYVMKPPIDYVIQSQATFLEGGNQKSWVELADQRWQNLGSGWHPVETFAADTSIRYRWSKEESVVYLTNAFAEHKLEMEVFGPASFVHRPSVFDLLINGEKVAHVELHVSQWERIAVDCRAPVGPVEIRLQVQDIFRPADYFSNSDYRELGIGVRRIAFAPVGRIPAVPSAISVIIPTYNRIDKLLAVLRGLESQTVEKDLFEVIVVDDGSADGTADRVRRYARNSTLNLEFHQQAHQLQGAARNLGIRRSTKPIVLFLGDDILPHEKLLEQHLRAHGTYGNHPRIAVLGHIAWAPHLRVTPFMKYVSERGPQFAYGMLQENVPLSCSYFYTSNVSVAREILAEQPHVFDEDFQSYGWEDMELAYRLEKRGLRLLYNPRAIAYHDHPITIGDFCKRQYVTGRSSRLFLGKHPEFESTLFPTGELRCVGAGGLGERIGQRLASLADRYLRLPLSDGYYGGVLWRHYAVGARNGADEAALAAAAAAPLSEGGSPTPRGDSLRHSSPSTPRAHGPGPAAAGAGTKRPAAKRTTGIHFYLATAGSEFLADIAECFREACANLGLDSSLRWNEIPRCDDPTVMHVLVAPQEAFPLHLEKKLGQKELAALTRNCYLLCTEQPGSTWFETAFPYAAIAKGVFDINIQAVREFRRRGVAAVYTPLGYTPLLEAPRAGGDTKDIDIVFLGHRSPQRELFLAQHAERLEKYRCRLIFATLDKPRQLSTPGYYGRDERNRLLQRSRILINLHSSDRNYFEWHRVLPCLANRCLVISETSTDHQPLIAGKHLVLCGRAELMDRCEYYLQHETQRADIAAEACQFLQTELRIEESCRTICQRPLVAWRDDGWDPQGEPGPATADRTASATRVARFARRMARSAWRRAWACRKIVPAPGRRLARKLCQVARILPGLAPRPATPLPASSADLEFDRQQLLDALERAPRRQAEDTGSGHQVLPGVCYQDAHRPAVTVLVYSRQHAEFLSRCLTSIVAAEREDLPGGTEVVVVDDASADGSAEIASAEINRLGIPGCVVAKCVYTGVAESRNLGIRLARGCHVLVLDADRWIFPSCLSKLYAAMRDAGTAAAYAAVKRVDLRTGQPAALLSLLDWDVERLIAGPYIDAAALFDREVLLAVGGYSTELVHHGLGWEDYDLWLKLAQARHAAAYRPEILSAVEFHERSALAAADRYAAAVIPYLQDKFAELLRRYPREKTQFGRPVSVRVTTSTRCRPPAALPAAACGGCGAAAELLVDAGKHAGAI
jgi:glycosyltransferase involved in cell wall biosynthesis